MTDTTSSSIDAIDAADGVGAPGDHHEAVIAEALGVIDGALGRMTGRDIVSSSEVSDLLLDVRTLLTQSAIEPAGTA